MKKSLLFFLVFGLALVTLIGCGSEEVIEEGKIIVGTMPLTVGVPIQYALDNGYYEDEGLDVKIKIFSTGAPINEAFSASEIEVAASGLASVYSLANVGAKWIGEINTTGGMGIYVRPDSPVLEEQGKANGKPSIFGSADLVKGMKILGPLGTTAQFNAIGYANSFGLRSSDIQQVHMEYGAAYQAFKSGEGDAFAANPPFSFQAEDEGYICAATFEDATNVSLLDGIFASADMVKERRNDLVKFIRATYKACEDLQDHDIRFEYSKKWFNENGKVYDDKTLESEMEVREYITQNAMEKPSYIFGEGMTAIANFFAEDGKITKDNLPNVKNSYDTTIIEDALNIDVKVDK